MPISKYFGGHGESVLADMIRKHGQAAGTREFYATANKMKKKYGVAIPKKEKP